VDFGRRCEQVLTRALKRIVRRDELRQDCDQVEETKQVEADDRQLVLAEFGPHQLPLRSTVQLFGAFPALVAATRILRSHLFDARLHGARTGRRRHEFFF